MGSTPSGPRPAGSLRDFTPRPVAPTLRARGPRRRLRSRRPAPTVRRDVLLTDFPYCARHARRHRAGWLPQVDSVSLAARAPRPPCAPRPEPSVCYQRLSVTDMIVTDNTPTLMLSATRGRRALLSLLPSTVTVLS